MDRSERRAIEQRIIIAAAEGLIDAGCTVTVTEEGAILLANSTDPHAIETALVISGEPGFYVSRALEGTVEKGWIDFVGEGGIYVSADPHLNIDEALRGANELAKTLGVAPAQ